MDQRFVDLLAERQEAVESLLSEMSKFTYELRRRVQELRGLINIAEHNNVQQRLYRERWGLFDDLVYDITIADDLKVIVDTYIEPSGWSIDIWADKGDASRLRGLLERLKIPFEPGSEPGTFDYRDTFAFNENLDRIREVVQDLVDQLATSGAESQDRVRSRCPPASLLLPVFNEVPL